MFVMILDIDKSVYWEIEMSRFNSGVYDMFEYGDDIRKLGFSSCILLYILLVVKLHVW